MSPADYIIIPNVSAYSRIPNLEPLSAVLRTKQLE